MAEPRKHFNVLDIFRGIFASMIVFFHLRTYTITSILNNDFIANASLFVNFFFVLSGFVIAYNYRHIDNITELRSFLTKRFRRLYPLHLFLLGIFLVYFLFKKMMVAYFHYPFLFAADNWKTFICSLFLIQSVKIQHFNESLSWNYPSWSISAEMIAYLFFGASEFLLYKAGLKKMRILFYLLIICFSIGSFFYDNVMYQWIAQYDNGMLYGLFGFYFGVVCVSLYNAGHQYLDAINRNIFSVLEIVLIALLPYLISKGQMLLPLVGLWFYNVYFLTTILVFSFQKGLLSGFLVKPDILKKIGNYSYSIYMNHLIVILLFNFILTKVLKISPVYYSFLFIIVYYIVYRFSAWTFRHVEMKFYKKNNKKLA